MSLSGFDIVETPSLRLERLRAEHRAHLDRMHRDERVMSTLGGLRSADETTALVERLLEHWETHGYGIWCALDRANGRFVGRGGLRHVQIEGRDEVEVAYAFLPDQWGRGLATELTLASARVAFDGAGREDLVAFTLPTNMGSRRVMEKSGLHYERDIQWAGQPHVLYWITARGWRQETCRGDESQD